MQLPSLSKYRAFTYVVLFSLSCTALSNNTTTFQFTVSGLKQELDKKAVDLLKVHGVPSVAVAYLDEGKVAWTAIYGEQGPNQPADMNTLLI